MNDSNHKVLLTGLAASNGVRSGKARVIESLDQISEIKEGEILVTTKTTPDFIIAFGKIIAVVTDQGGITSHAAIVSRELSIPAVVGTKKATEILATGQLITVDGNSGEIFDGEVILEEESKPTKQSTRPIPTGDDVNDFIEAVTYSVNDATELWPMKPGQLITYFDMDQCLNLYQRLKKLKEKGELPKVAKLLEHPTIIRMFVVNSGISGMKAATMLKVNNNTVENQIEFFNLLLGLLKELMPNDPLCMQGTNKVWPHQKVKEYVSNSEWTKMDDELRRAVNLLAVSLNTYIWAFYWDYTPDAGFETYGTYHVDDPKFGSSHTLLINDFFNLKPTEIWSLSQQLAHKQIILSQVYDSEDAFFRIGNRIANQDQLSGRNNFFSLQVDGKSVSDKKEILVLAEKIGKLAQKQADFVNNLEEFDVIRKGAQLSYYSWKKLYQYLGEGWYPESVVEGTIKKVGREFLDKFAQESNRSLEDKKRFFDPRNDYL